MSESVQLIDSGRILTQSYHNQLYFQEMDRLRKQLGGTVNVEVDAAPSIDLGQIMENMRQQYEVMAEKNRQEAKDRFDKQVLFFTWMIICPATLHMWLS